MSLPRPAAGLVIRYAYLWHHEYEKGLVEGPKDRPCAILTVKVNEDGRVRLQVLPITHSPPSDPHTAVEIPGPAKLRLGLDGERSWIMVSELNEFTWPGYDLRPGVPGDASSVAIGYLPPGLFALVKSKYLALHTVRRISAADRD